MLRKCWGTCSFAVQLFFTTFFAHVEKNLSSEMRGSEPFTKRFIWTSKFDLLLEIEIDIPHRKNKK